MGRVKLMPDYLKNILHTQFFSILNIIVGFVSLFLLIKYLHVEEYGEYVLIQGFLAFVGLIISQNIYSYARLKIPGSEENIQYGYLKTVISLVSGFYLFIFIVIWLFGLSEIFWNFFEINLELSLIVVLMLALELINAEIMRFLIALKNIHIKNYAQFFQKVFILFVVLGLLFLDSLSLNSFLYLFIVGQIIVLFYLINHIQVKIFFNAPFMKDVIQKGYQIALPLIPIGLMSLALNYTDTLMIAKMIDKESVAQYGFSSQIVSIVMMIIGTSIILTLFPYATESFNKNDLKRKNDFFIKMYIYSISLSIIFYVLIVLNITWFVELLNLESYKDVPIYLMILAIFPIFQSIYNVSSHNMQLLKIVKVQLYIAIFVIFCNVILNFFFIKKFGVIGAAYASLISFMLLSIVYFILTLKNDLYLRESFSFSIRKIIVLIGIFLLLFLLLFFINKQNLYFVLLGNILVFVSLGIGFKKLRKGFRK
ncbi:MAG: MATE family efflux transporter [Arcobacter sp.]|uniref:MATE family efflux transporter n=1 Tax=Arcobacter sp. TaxID=1872629 RepID=UPI003D043B52